MRLMSCLLLAACLPALAWAQAPTTQPARDKRIYGDRYPGSATVAEALAQPVAEVHLADCPLHEAIEWVRGASGLNVVVRWSKLEEVGVDGDARITLHLRQVPLKRVLEIILDLARDQVELGFEGEQNLLIISTQADLDRNLVVQSYDVTELTVQIPDFAGPSMRLDTGIVPRNYYRDYYGYGFYDTIYGFGRPFDYDEPQEEDPVEELISKIINLIEPDSWLINGGRGTIVALGDLIIVRNSRRVQRMLAEAFDLRPLGEPTRPSPAEERPAPDRKK